METIDARQFETLRRSTLARFGRISSNTGHGLIIDLQLALDRAGLAKPKIKWRGGDDGLLTVTGDFDGQPEEWATKALTALDKDFLYEDGVATLDVSPATVHITVATWAPDLGLATVQIYALRLTSGDIAGR